MASNSLVKAREEIERIRKSAARARNEAKEAPMKVSTRGLFIGGVTSAGKGLLNGLAPATDSPMVDIGLAGAFLGIGMVTGNPDAIEAAKPFLFPRITSIARDNVARFRGGE